jgi:hypothetical protein
MNQGICVRQSQFGHGEFASVWQFKSNSQAIYVENADSDVKCCPDSLDSLPMGTQQELYSRVYPCSH